MPADPVDVGTRPQLFVDDYLIAHRDGLVEQLHPMTKHPSPVLTSTAPWERPDRGGLWGIPNALYDPDERLFQLWYNSLGSYPAIRDHSEPAYVCYATSRDGITDPCIDP